MERKTEKKDKKKKKKGKQKKEEERTGRNKNECLVVNKQLALWIFNKLVVCVGYRLALFQYYTILISDVETVYFCKWLDCYRDPYRVKKHCRWLLITEMFTGSKWSDPHCSLVSSYLRALQNLIHTAANVTICLPGVTVSISLWFLKHFKRCFFFFFPSLRFLRICCNSKLSCSHNCFYKHIVFRDFASHLNFKKWERIWASSRHPTALVSSWWAQRCCVLSSSSSVSPACIRKGTLPPSNPAQFILKMRYRTHSFLFKAVIFATDLQTFFAIPSRVS